MSNNSDGRPLFGLNTAIDGIVYCGRSDMFSSEPREELDLLSVKEQLVVTTMPANLTKVKYLREQFLYMLTFRQSRTCI